MMRHALAWVIGIVLAGCASASQPVTLNDLQGDWKGDWAWKGPDDVSRNSGEASLILKRVDETTWMLDGVIPSGQTGLPGDRLTMPLKQAGAGELSGEMMGGTIKITLDPQPEGVGLLTFEVSHPALGSASAKGSLLGNRIWMNYSETKTHGNGTYILKRKKS